MDDVPDLVRVALVATIGNSEHSSVGGHLNSSAVPHLCVSTKVSLTHQANCNAVCGVKQNPSLRNIWAADNPVEDLNQHLCLLVVCYVYSSLDDVIIPLPFIRCLLHFCQEK